MNYFFGYLTKTDIKEEVVETPVETPDSDSDKVEVYSSDYKTILQQEYEKQEYDEQNQNNIIGHDDDDDDDFNNENDFENMYILGKTNVNSNISNEINDMVTKKEFDDLDDDSNNENDLENMYILGKKNVDSKSTISSEINDMVTKKEFDEFKEFFMEQQEIIIKMRKRMKVLKKEHIYLKESLNKHTGKLEKINEEIKSVKKAACKLKNK